MKKILTMILATAVAAGCLFFTACDQTGSSESPPPAPDAPANIVATDGLFGNQVQVSWIEADRAETYKIYRAIDSVDSEYRLHTSGVKASDWADATVTPGRFYFYRVVAANRGGDSPMSSTDMGYAGDLAPKPPLPPASDSLVATQDVLHHVYLKWEAVTGALRYHVYRSDMPTGTYTRISANGGILPDDLDSIEVDGVFYSFDDDSAFEGRAYYYRISCENDDGEGARSDVISGWFPYDVPPAPTGVSATDGDYSNKVVVSWNSVTEANTYSVYRSTSAVGGGACSETPSDYTNIGTGISGLSFDDSAVADDNVYCYAVRSVNAAGSSDYSDKDKGNRDASGVAVPSAPDNIAATNNQANQITVSWDRADAHAATYRVYRSTSASGSYGDYIGSVSDTGLDSYTFADTTANGITTDTTYYFKVRADGAGGVSSLSVHAQGMALPAVPPAPTIGASDGASWNSISIIWSEAARAVTYTLFRSESSSGPWDETTRIATRLTGTTYVDTTRNITTDYGKTYYYAVRGINSGGDGVLSSPDAGYVELGTPAQPSTGDAGYRHMSVSWNQIDACQGYIVEWVRSTVAWGTSPGSNTGQINVSGSATLTTTLSNGTLYYNYRFRVRAYLTDGGGNIVHSGPWSAWSGWENAD